MPADLPTGFGLRKAGPADDDALWRILEPVFRAGETYCLPRDVSRGDALAYWAGGNHQAFLVEEDGRILGTYFLCANQQGGGAHVANAGFATAPEARGKGLARAMLADALEQARAQGFRAMQFNFVVTTNTRAIALWEAAGFETVGRLPQAFLHPEEGYVDALVMIRQL
jgi:ribosomal protein S18 acetylase RimI-like enzyme